MINSFCINNTHVSRILRTGARLNVHTFALVAPNIETEFRLSSEDNNRITYLDMVIADAVYSVYQTQATLFSEGILLRVLSGDEKQTCRKETKEKIASSLKKMANIEFTLNCSEEVEARKIDECDFSEEHTEPFLILETLNSGKYRTTNPLLYRYADEVNKQLISVPHKLWCLDHKKPVNDSLENIALKHYLLHRLAVANHNYDNKSFANLNRIYYYYLSHKKREEGESPYTGMLFDLGIVSAWEKENGKLYDKYGKDIHSMRLELSRLKHHVHGKTRKILDALVEIGYIEGYSFIKEGKEIIGIQIKGKAKSYEDFRDTLDE